MNAMEFIRPLTRKTLLEMGYKELSDGRIVWYNDLTGSITREATMYTAAYIKNPDPAAILVGKQNKITPLSSDVMEFQLRKFKRKTV
jgi:hypothetical protein